MTLTPTEQQKVDQAATAELYTIFTQEKQKENEANKT